MSAKKKPLGPTPTAPKPIQQGAAKRPLRSVTFPKQKQAPATTPCLEAALALVAKYDWTIFAADVALKKGYQSGDYAPEGLRWGQTKDPALLRKNFLNKNWRDVCGVGIPTGADNKIFVIEADTLKGHDVDGLGELRKLEAKHGKLPDTLMVESPSGSVHRYYKHPGGYVKETNSEIAPGVDIKGDGNMVIAPPSVRADGVYKWLNDLPIVDAPQWLVDLVQSEERAASSSDDTPRDAGDLLDISTIKTCLAIIPNNDDDVGHGYSYWHSILMKTSVSSGASVAGLQLFDGWSRKAPGKYNAKRKYKTSGQQYVMEKWAEFAKKPPHSMKSPGGLIWEAEQVLPGWRDMYFNHPELEPLLNDFHVLLHGISVSKPAPKKINPAPDTSEPPPKKINPAPDTSEPPPKDEMSGAAKRPKPFVPSPDATQAPGAPPQPMFDPWAKHIVPPFPIDVLPPVLRDFVVSQSEVIGVDHGSVAMTVLATLSGALDHRFRVKIMENGNWYARPRLWVLLYGDASLKKTPIIDTATEPLEDYQSEVQKEYQQNFFYHKIAVNMAKVKGKEPPPEEPHKPTRYVVYDTTIEKLGELLERSGRGLLVKHDEFSGWIGSMEKYTSGKGGKANRAFYLKAYDGQPYIVDRLSRDELFIELLSISMIGGIQPEKLIELHGLTSDGLLQRFLPVVMSHASLPIDRAVNIKDYTSLVRTLIRQKPVDLMFNIEALKVVTETREYLYRLGKSVGGMGGAFQSFVGKLDGIIGSLAINLHMALHPENPLGWSINKATALNVRRLMRDFLIPHALEFYRVVDIKTDSDQLRKLASWVLTNGKERLVASDLTSNIAGFRGLGVVEVNERVSPLIAGGWLQPVEKGNLCRAWTVKPEVFVEFAARTQEEELRKQELAELFNSPRRSK